MQRTSSARRPTGVLLLLALAACAPGEAPDSAAAGEPEEKCRVVQRGVPLPLQVDESSGLAASRRTPGVFWTHNDSGGDPTIFAVDSAGRLLGVVRVTGAENRDWEDLAVGPCPAGSCLYVGDIGDNAARRRDVEVYRVPEPAPGDAATAPAEIFRLRYPGGPRDAESLFVLPDGGLYLVNKGRGEPVELFRAPQPLRAGPAQPLTRVAELSAREPTRLNMVTGAAATSDGRWVAIRTYTGLHLFRTSDLLAGRMPESDRVDLASLEEPQGEGVEIREDGTVYLTSESPGKGDPAVLSKLSCTLG